MWDFPKTFKLCLMIGVLVNLSLLVGSVILATFFGPSGFTILSYTINLLGSGITTPFLLIFDNPCVIGGITSILLYSNICVWRLYLIAINIWSTDL